MANFNEMVAALEAMTPRATPLNLDALMGESVDSLPSHVDSVRYVRMLLDGTVSEEM